MKIMKFTKAVLKNLFSKPATSMYPIVKKDYPEGTRGKVSIDIDSCILCGICSKRCPSDAITVDREAKKWSIDPFGCVSCAACVVACPKKCLSMDKEYTDPAQKKADKSFTKEE